MGRYGQSGYISGRVVGIDFGRPADFSLTAPGFYFNADLSLPARGDCLIKIGNRAPSTGFNVFYFKSLISLV